jgi:BirA family biotin operon repressor/biotin-[acetyl-CoA-carboxylase] ligase
VLKAADCDTRHVVVTRFRTSPERTRAATPGTSAADASSVRPARPFILAGVRSLAIDLLRELGANGAARVAALAAASGATRAAVERRLARLLATGWVEREADEIRLPAPFDFLDADRISAALGARAAEIEVRVLDACPSTNTTLLAGALDAPTRLLAAEEQTAGRGRRGRRWLSCVGAGLTFSVGRRMACPARELAPLSIAAGVASVRALRTLGAGDVTLKWPNDLMVQGAKLGGILAETRVRGPVAAAVVGIGLNWRVARGLEARLRRRIAVLEDCVRPLPSRNLIVARIAAEMLDALAVFEARGLEPFTSDWAAFDAYRGQRLRVRLADGRVLAGVAEGLAGDGGLRLRTRSGVRAVRGGRVVNARVA